MNWAGFEHLVDFSGESICKRIWSEMIRAMPNAYKEIRYQLRFYVPEFAHREYLHLIESRHTCIPDSPLDHGWKEKLSCYGIPLVIVPKLEQEIILTLVDNWPHLGNRDAVVIGYNLGKCE